MPAKKFDAIEMKTFTNSNVEDCLKKLKDFIDKEIFPKKFALIDLDISVFFKKDESVEKVFSYIFYDN